MRRSGCRKKVPLPISCSHDHGKHVAQLADFGWGTRANGCDKFCPVRVLGRVTEVVKRSKSRTDTRFDGALCLKIDGESPT